MPAALQRGIAHYQGGTSAVSPDDAAFVADRAASYNQGRGVTAITPAAPAASAAPSGVSQLFSGDFAAARDNPESSPLTSTLGQFADYLSRSNRALTVGQGPLVHEWLGNLFAGNKASTAALMERADAAKKLNDPLVQQYITSNPDQLAIAERDPRGYAAVSTDPNFRATMAQAVGAHADAAANDRVSQTEHAQTVKGATDNNVTAAQSHAALAPHKYTKDEFVKLFTGMPVSQLAMLFGQQLGHVPTVQEKAATKVLDHLHGVYADADAKVKKMEAEDAALEKAGQPKKHDIYMLPFTGPSPYEAGKAERDKALKATMDALSQAAGITTKGFVTPETR